MAWAGCRTTRTVSGRDPRCVSVAPLREPASRPPWPHRRLRRPSLLPSLPRRSDVERPRSPRPPHAAARSSDFASRRAWLSRRRFSCVADGLRGRGAAAGMEPASSLTRSKPSPAALSGSLNRPRARSSRPSGEIAAALSDWLIWLRMVGETAPRVCKSCSARRVSSESAFRWASRACSKASRLAPASAPAWASRGDVPRRAAGRFRGGCCGRAG